MSRKLFSSKLWHSSSQKMEFDRICKKIVFAQLFLCKKCWIVFKSQRDDLWRARIKVHLICIHAPFIVFFLKNGQFLASFCWLGHRKVSFYLFSSFSQCNDKYSTIDCLWKSVDGVLEIWTLDRRVQRADESTQLWWSLTYADLDKW